MGQVSCFTQLVLKFQVLLLELPDTIYVSSFFLVEGSSQAINEIEVVDKKFIGHTCCVRQ